jgi:succinate dehydrogenase cytochrome b subunit
MPQPLSKADSLLTSTVGRKAVMAVTGVVGFGYVLGHMTGNLQVFLGAESIDAYAKFLHHFLHGYGIWAVRAVLSVCLVLHVWAAWSLTLTSRKARPIGYTMVTHDESTYASRTMRWGGPLILLFIVYHLLDLTIGRVNPGFVPGAVYRNLVAGFQRPVVTAFYVLAMLALAFHLQHGVWSMLQTLGASHPRYDPWRKRAATAFAILVCGGFILVPLAILAGFVK